MDTIRVGTTCCDGVALFLDGGLLACRACGITAVPGTKAILSAVPVRDEEPEADDYVRHTKIRYQSEEYATEYLREYRWPRSPTDLYARYVAWRERSTVAHCLRSRRRDVASLLDIPAGTGKLAAVHAAFPYAVVAADISVEMMAEGLSRGEWSECRNIAGVVRADVMDLRFVDDAVDAVVCLRLLHRLPEPLVVRALEQMARVARKYLVVSTRISGGSVMSAFQRSRPDRARFDRRDWTKLLGRFGVVEEQRHISPRVSTEIVSVVRVG
jgi:SAM-dependent methyltransferase